MRSTLARDASSGSRPKRSALTHDALAFLRQASCHLPEHAGVAHAGCVVGWDVEAAIWEAWIVAAFPVHDAILFGIERSPGLFRRGAQHEGEASQVEAAEGQHAEADIAPGGFERLAKRGVDGHDAFHGVGAGLCSPAREQAAHAEADQVQRAVVARQKADPEGEAFEARGCWPEIETEGPGVWLVAEHL